MNPNDIRSDLEDELSELDPPYRSRQEAQLGRMLDRYGIPFFFEQPVLVYDNGRHEIVKPAFTLPTYAGLVMEYANKPEGVHRRQRLYQDNGIAAVIAQPSFLHSSGTAPTRCRINSLRSCTSSLMNMRGDCQP